MHLATTGPRLCGSRQALRSCPGLRIHRARRACQAHRRTARKLASRFFHPAPPTRTRPEPTQSLNTHQGGPAYWYGIAPGCVVAPNSSQDRVYLRASGGVSVNGSSDSGHTAWVVYDGSGMTSHIDERTGKWIDNTGKWVSLDYSAKIRSSTWDLVFNGVPGQLTFGTQPGEPTERGEFTRYGASALQQNVMLQRAVGISSNPGMYFLFNNNCGDVTCQIGQGIPGVTEYTQHQFIAPWTLPRIIQENQAPPTPMPDVSGQAGRRW